MTALPAKLYSLVGVDGKPYTSAEKGTLGGHRRTKSSVAWTARPPSERSAWWLRPLPGVLRRQRHCHQGWLPTVRGLHARRLPSVEGPPCGAIRVTNGEAFPRKFTNGTSHADATAGPATDVVD